MNCDVMIASLREKLLNKTNELDKFEILYWLFLYTHQKCLEPSSRLRIFSKIFQDIKIGNNININAIINKIVFIRDTKSTI